LRLLPTVVQVAQTLGFAHSRGVVHRDIKPANILVGQHGDAVVVDWGIARVRGAAAEFVHAVMGTLAYMSPEQARGDGAAVDERTDVFALGALLYHLLSGRAPFAGKSPMVALTSPLRAVVARAMSVDPSRRYANADQFADALGAVLTDAVQREPPSVVMRAAVDVTIALSALLARVFARSASARGRSDRRRAGRRALGGRVEHARAPLAPAWRQISPPCSTTSSPTSISRRSTAIISTLARKRLTRSPWPWGWRALSSSCGASRDGALSSPNAKRNRSAMITGHP
jgi:serine/threonine-protein kinase